MSAAPKLDQNNPLFDKRLLNAFVENVVKTLSNMAQTPVTPEKPFIENNFSSKGEVAGMVGMVAPPLKGSFIITFPKEAILLIYENMLGEKHAEVNSEVADSVGELTNMIYGSSKTILNQLGYNFEMAIPTVVRGEFIVSKREKGPNLVIPFALGNGSKFYLEVTIQN